MKKILSILVLALFSVAIFSCNPPTVLVPKTDCEEVKELQYSIVDGYYQLILVETDNFTAFISEDSLPGNKECCIRNKGVITATCIPCSDFVAFVNSQLNSCSIRY